MFWYRFCVSKKGFKCKQTCFDFAFFAVVQKEVYVRKQFSYRFCSLSKKKRFTLSTNLFWYRFFSTKERGFKYKTCYTAVRYSLGMTFFFFLVSLPTLSQARCQRRSTLVPAPRHAAARSRVSFFVCFACGVVGPSDTGRTGSSSTVIPCTRAIPP